jgi:hypothetical protein
LSGAWPDAYKKIKFKQRMVFMSYSDEINSYQTDININCEGSAFPSHHADV